MINCQYLVDNKCNLPILATPIATTEDICNYCLGCDNPKQLNKATATLAVGYLLRTNQFNEVEHKYLKDILTIPKLTQGPGTELKKLVSWFVWLRDIKDCKSCYDREQQMNQWGPDECRKNISTIVEWLRESAAKHNLPFSESLVKIIINKAIRNSEKHYEMVCCGNNCTT